ncbi:hypothetical protein P2H44_02555 [Albimonas sp. CAU 1670]|uniref:hypothetical protein n=1 Tax=Albimonas sp. CAU 1670 TaxID=3032599 RepID=UPI0023DC8E13|nr:hypothetical protein [Albimonas sp. CAU 1670]MDF2231425.1 hypothetical protein [Albimonas sp. CAU 1670]
MSDPRRPSTSPRPPRRRWRAFGCALVIALAAGPAMAQLYQPNLPSVARQPGVKPCCQGYDARGAARALSVQQQQLRASEPVPLSVAPPVEALTLDGGDDDDPIRSVPAPVETRPGVALDGAASAGPGTVYDDASRGLFRPRKPPAPLN